MKKLGICFLLLFLTGCADSVTFTQAANMNPVGFLHGVWHGLIVGFSFIGSLFSDNISIYAIYNNGGWYDFGFLLGLSGIFSGITSNSRR